MKTLFITLFILCFFSFKPQAQITFEHNYPTYLNSDQFFGLVKLNEGVYNWAEVEVLNSPTIKLYNLNHSVNKVISMPFPAGNAGNKVRFISTTLFDCDSSNIEYLVSNGDDVKIYREDGTVLFTEDSCYLYDQTNTSVYNKGGVVNTPDGTKMYLVSRKAPSFSVNVYSLCGTLTSNIPVNEINQISLGAFPNPTKDVSRIQYKLPANISMADLVFYDLNGKEIKSMKVDKNFSDVMISTEDISSGTYLYILKSKGEILQSKKLVVIK